MPPADFSSNLRPIRGKESLTCLIESGKSVHICQRHEPLSCCCSIEMLSKSHVVVV